MTLAQELIGRNSGRAASVASVAPTASSVRKVAAPTGALADAAKTAEACAILGSRIGSEIEKTAAQGVDPEVTDLHLTLRKAAHYLGDLVDLVGAQKKAHASLLSQFEEKARIDEALKLASELIRDGLVPVPDDFAGYVQGLATKNLEVVKAAAEMAATADFGSLGSPERFEDKTASVAGAPNGDGVRPEWEQSHGFLLR